MRTEYRIFVFEFVENCSFFQIFKNVCEFNVCSSVNVLMCVSKSVEQCNSMECDVFI